MPKSYLLLCDVNRQKKKKKLFTSVILHPSLHCLIIAYTLNECLFSGALVSAVCVAQVVKPCHQSDSHTVEL